MKTSNIPTIFCVRMRLTAKSFLFLALIMISFLRNAKSQSPNNLIQLKGYPFEVFYSSGQENKAKEIATKCDSAIIYMYQNVLGFKPVIKVFILNPEDWKQFAVEPLYGLPHYQGQKLFVAAQDNPFWKSFIPPMEKLSPEMAKTIQKLFRTNNGNLSFERFFDLLSLHELGHVFALQDSVYFSRKWLNELFANLFLHTYIAEKEPNLLPILEAAPKMNMENTAKSFEHTTLQDLELFYGKMDPNNYGWYQTRLHIAAKQLYDTSGVNVLRALWRTFLNNKIIFTDSELKDILTSKVPEVAKIMTEW